MGSPFLQVAAQECIGSIVRSSKDSLRHPAESFVIDPVGHNREQKRQRAAPTATAAEMPALQGRNHAATAGR